jgi:hypothetical protein
MKRKRFTITAAPSALLCAGLVVLWVLSFRGDSQFDFDALGARYTLGSSWGRVALLGAPREGPDDAAAAAIAARMSVEDFQWGMPVQRRGSWQVRGDVRRGTPTWEMFRWFYDRLPNTNGMNPAVRVWLKALDDRRTFVPAHMFLSLRFDPGEDGTVDAGVPGIYVPVTPGTDRPLLEFRPDVRDAWHARFATPVASVFYGWPVAATLVLPIAWAARPRRTIQGRRRLAAAWAFNAAAIVSLLLCAAGSAAWVRGYWATDEWVFWPHSDYRSVQLRSIPLEIGFLRVASSSKGRVAVQQGITLYSFGPGRVGYRKRTPQPLVARRPVPGVGSSMPGDRYWSAPGVEYFHRDVQDIRVSAPTPPPVPRWQTNTAESLGPPSPFGPMPTTTTAIGPQPSPTRPTAPGGQAAPGQPVASDPWAFLSWPTSRASPAPPARYPPSSGSVAVVGERVLIVSWWLPVLCSAILPAAWARKALTRRRQARRARRDQCPSCGYNLRATPERCPECGAVPGRGADA